MRKITVKQQTMNLRILLNIISWKMMYLLSRKSCCLHGKMRLRMESLLKNIYLQAVIQGIF